MRIVKFLASSPIHQLTLTHQAVAGAIQRALKPEGVHLLQALLLTGLFFEDRGVRPTELAKAYEVSPSNLSHALRGLEKAALVTRSNEATDARAYVFELTKEGRKKALRLIKQLDRTQSQLEAQLNTEKTIAALRAFREIKIR